MRNSNFIKNSIVALFPISLCIGVLFGVDFKSANKVDAYSYNALKQMDIKLDDSPEEEIRNYYYDLLGQSESERQGTNLLKNLKPILSENQVYYSYDSTDAIWKLYEIVDRDWIKSPANKVLNGTYNAATNTIENYVFRASEYLDDERNPYVHALYNDRSIDNEARAWGRDRDTEKDIRHNQLEHGINREHIWAKSHGFQDEGDKSGGARGDPMHLWAADGYSNNLHNNHYFGYVDTTKSYKRSKGINDGRDFTYTGNNLLGISKTMGSKTVFEPQDSDKGDIARALFYMVARYNNYAGDTEGIDTNNPNLILDNNINTNTGTSTWDNPFGMGVLDDLLEWNKIDPPDEFEIHRNNLLFTNFTNNRNPFIDFPEWADICFAGLEKAADPRIDLINGKSEERTLVNISISSKAEKTSYLEGETFSPKGLTIRANYSDGTHEFVNDYTYSPITPLTASDSKITINYEDKSIALPIEVREISGVAVKYFEKVENIQENGSYLIVSEDNMVAWKEANASAGHSVAFTYEDDKIAYTKDLENSLFGINFNAGYIQDSNYKFIGNNKDQTTLQTSNNPIKNTIILNDGIIDIYGEQGAHLRCNQNGGQPIFKYYKSSSYSTFDQLSIYKLVVKQKQIVHPSIVTVTPSSTELELGSSLLLGLSILPIDATNQEVIWESNKPNVISVDENGQITALSSGTATITATAKDNGVFGSCTVIVPEPIILDHILLTGSYKTKFYVGDEFSNDGIVVTAYYTQGGVNVDEVDVTEETEFSGFDSSEPGTCTITASYNGKDATYDVQVDYIPVEENSVNFVMTQFGLDRGVSAGLIQKDGYSILFNSTKTKYYDPSVRVYGGNTFTIAGAKKIVGVSFVFEEGDKEYSNTLNVDDTIACDSTTGEWHNSSGVESITYKVSGSSGQRRIEQIKVTYDPESHTEVKLQTISLDASCKKSFFVGDEFDYTGLKVIAHYTDSSSKFVTSGYTISTPNMDVVGNQTITVSYGGKEATYQITIKGIYLTKLDIKGGTREFYLNSEFNHDGLNVRAFYNNDDIKDVSKDVIISTPDMSKLGLQDVFVTYQDLTVSYEINIVRDPDAPVDILKSISTISSENMWENGEKYNTFAFDENVTVNVLGDDTGTYNQTDASWDLNNDSELHINSLGVYKLTSVKISYDSVGNGSLFYKGKAIESGCEVLLDQTDAFIYVGENSTPSKNAATNGIKIKNIQIVYIKGLASEETLSKIELAGNYKTTFYEDEEFNSEGLLVKATYSSGRIEFVTPSEVSGYTGTPGTNTIHVKYGGFDITYNVTVIAVVATSIEVSGDYQTDFFNNEQFNADGLIVTAYYNHGDPKEVEPTLIDGYDLSIIGQQTVVVHYGDLTDTYEINVKKFELSGITLEGTFPKEFYKNNVFNYNGLRVIANYTDGTHKEVKNFTVSTPDMSTTGNKTVTISYYEGSKTVSTSYQIKVLENELVEIQLSGTYKTTFLKDTSFSADGLIVTAVYSDGSTKVVSPTTIAGYNMFSVGEQEVTVTYTEGKKTVFASYQINVINPTLTKIEISGTQKTSFNVGDEFSSIGLQVTAYYSNSTYKVVEPTSISGYNMATAGTQEVTVTYEENGISKSATYKIVVKTTEKKKESSGISIPVVIAVSVGAIGATFAVIVIIAFAAKKRKMRK